MYALHKSKNKRGKKKPKALQSVEFWPQIPIGKMQNVNLQERYLLQAWDIKEHF